VKKKCRQKRSLIERGLPAGREGMPETATQREGNGGKNTPAARCIANQKSIKGGKKRVPQPAAGTGMISRRVGEQINLQLEREKRRMTT